MTRKRAQPVYEREIARLSHAGSENDKRGGGLRARIGRQLPGAALSVQTRNYGDDAYVIISPSGQPRMYDIRRACLHFQIDPIMIKYGVELQQRRSLPDLVQTAPLEDYW